MRAFWLLAQLNLNALPGPSVAGPDSVAAILRIVFSIIGAVCTLIITLAGFKYVTAFGNPTSTARAKDMIIYAAVGLAVSLSAVSIVTFVLRNAA